MQLIKHIFIKHGVTAFSLLVIVVFAVTLKVLAVSGGPFTAGETLNPNCLPTDVNCVITAATSGWAFDGDTNGSLKYIGTNDNFDFPIYTNGLERLNITSDGKFQVKPESGVQYIYTQSDPSSGFLTPRCSCDIDNSTGTPECGASFTVSVDEGNICYDQVDLGGEGGPSPSSYVYSRSTSTNPSVFIADSVSNKVGIFTDNPEFRLTLDKGTLTPDGGILAIGTQGSGQALTTAGAGTRFIWYPKKGAVRAGTVSGDIWDDANIGNNSVAFGSNKVSGASSFSAGSANDVGGAYSAALGFFNDLSTSSSLSFAIGSNNVSNGNVSVSIGSFANATGSRSLILGGGSGSGNELVNNISNSLMVGFNTIPTLFVDGGSVGIRTSSPDASSLLDLTSTTKGFLAPRMDTTARDLIVTPATGLEIFNTSTNQFEFYNGLSWVFIGSASDSGSVKVSLTSEQIKTLSSVPVDTGIPNPGLGKAIFVTSAAVKFIFNTTSFSFTNLELGNSDRSGAQYLWGGIDTQNVFSPMRPTDITGNPIIENSLLYVSTDADSLVGDGSIDVYINYKIITL